MYIYGCMGTLQYIPMCLCFVLVTKIVLKLAKKSTAFCYVPYIEMCMLTFHIGICFTVERVENKKPLDALWLPDFVTVQCVCGDLVFMVSDHSKVWGVAMHCRCKWPVLVYEYKLDKCANLECYVFYVEYNFTYCKLYRCSNDFNFM